ncbi:MAG: helix-turn-helix domain-containing protein, partial [Alicyclobacillus sp.]|nr:helix-turn-helix domain-containing protein [Alicyclobacillus sp.]
VRFAVGGLYTTPNMLQKSFDDAQKTLEILQRVPNLGPVALYSECGWFRLIHMAPLVELERFRDDHLAELLAHDAKHGDSLCETLYTYLTLQGNVAATARRLYVHPNTVSYRIRKIQSLLHVPLDDPLHWPALLAALYVHQYLSGTRSPLLHSAFPNADASHPS